MVVFSTKYEIHILILKKAISANAKWKQKGVESYCRNEKSVPDVDALQRPVHLRKYEISSTESRGIITLTLSSRNTSFEAFDLRLSLTKNYCGVSTMTSFVIIFSLVGKICLFVLV